MSKPIKLKKRIKVNENLKFNIYFDNILDINSSEEVKEFLVVEPKVKKKNNSGVSVLPIYDGKLGLVKVYRHAVSDFSIEVPRGFPEAGEKFSFSALRELKEETGLSCKKEDLIKIGSIASETGVVSGKQIVFLAEKCKYIKDHIPDELGFKDFSFYSLDSVNNLIKSNKIFDASSIAIIYLYKIFLEKN